MQRSPTAARTKLRRLVIWSSVVGIVHLEFYLSPRTSMQTATAAAATTTTRTALAERDHGRTLTLPSGHDSKARNSFSLGG